MVLWNVFWYGRRTLQILLSYIIILHSKSLARYHIRKITHYINKRCEMVYKSIYFNNIKNTQIVLKKILYNIELVRSPASSVFGAFFLARILLLISEMVIFGNGTIKDLEKAVVVWSSNWKLDSLDPINEMEYLENK